MTITRVKRLVLATLQQRGYIVLKKPEYELLRANAAATTALPRPAPQPVLVEGSPDDTPPLAEDVARLAAAAGISAGFERRRLLTVFLIARYLERVGVEGAVVDCGDGSPQTLGAFAAAFVSFGQKGRQLILYDASVDPAHRANPRLPLWGNERDLIGNTVATACPTSETLEPLPKEISGTGYPSERVSICRYVGRPIEAPQRIAFLGITNETYEANLAGIRLFAPRVPSGGIIAVTGAASEPRARILQLLQKDSPSILFLPVAKDYLVGVKP